MSSENSGRESDNELDGTVESNTPQPTDEWASSFVQSGQEIGRYTLRERIGEGGMGEVWDAKQAEPVKRRVALKLIKAGMDSKAVLKRFEQERQALALMDHPNIARVLDGGLTKHGQPFFVMELVSGHPLDEFCDQAKLSLQQRLELFVPICQAVQHAHHKGIVHRDLKPSNILVTVIDGQPVPKIIDFGLAKAFGNGTSQDTMTQFGAVVGTLEYMSPEQANYSVNDIDTRTDIYSLGVILYELLTGLRPIDQARLKKAAITEMVRIIREEEPSKPSTRLSGDGTLPSVAALRKTEPSKLMALLRGELDWLVMKCLEKDRDRRYETANALLRDIQRYLADEPVEARPASTTYRLSKFIKRNKGPMAAVSLLVISLLGGIAGTTWGLFEAKRNALAFQAATIAKDEALQESVAKGIELQSEIKEKNEALQAVTRFNELLTGIFRSPVVGKEGKQLKVVDLLDAVAGRLEPISERQPEAGTYHVYIHQLLGDTYQSLGAHSKAIPLRRQVVEYSRRAFGSDNGVTMIELKKLGESYSQSERWADSLIIHEELLPLNQDNLGINHDTTLETMMNLAMAYEGTGSNEKAISLKTKVGAILDELRGPNALETLEIKMSLALSTSNAGRLDQAIAILEKTLRELGEAIEKDPTSTLSTMTKSEKWSYLRETLERAIEQRKEILAPKLKEHFVDDFSGETLDPFWRLFTLVKINGKNFERKIEGATVSQSNGVVTLSNPSVSELQQDVVLYSKTLPAEDFEASVDFRMPNGNALIWFTAHEPTDTPTGVGGVIKKLFGLYLDGTKRQYRIFHRINENKGNVGASGSFFSNEQTSWHTLTLRYDRIKGVIRARIDNEVLSDIENFRPADMRFGLLLKKMPRHTELAQVEFDNFRLSLGYLSSDD